MYKKRTSIVQFPSLPSMASQLGVIQRLLLTFLLLSSLIGPFFKEWDRWKEQDAERKALDPHI